MGCVPLYPEFALFSEQMKDELEPVLRNLEHGFSGLTFYCLCVHAVEFSYRITKTLNDVFLLCCDDDSGRYLIFLNGLPDSSVCQSLIQDGRKIIFLPNKLKEENNDYFERLNVELVPDRDRFEYVYLRSDLAELKGKDFHKKKNHLNKFNKAYKSKSIELNETSVYDALKVLDEWEKRRSGEKSDYESAKKALSLIGKSPFSGRVVYVDEKPVGFFLGEYISNGTMYCTHFEKGLDEYTGIYQFLNWLAAKTVDDSVVYINREEDLGDEGLRQAKMTYRPCGFIESFRQR